MKSFINMIKRRQKGSLTVEAAVVLPIFICAILTIGFLTKIVYTHEIIQHAINEAANEMASSSYLYYVSGAYDIDDTLSNELEERKEKSEEHINHIVDSFKELNGSISQIKSSSKDIYENADSGDISEVSKPIDEIISQGADLEGSIDDMKFAFQDIAKDSKGEMISLASLFAKEALDRSKTTVGNILINQYLKKHSLTDAKLKSLNIDKLDFSSSAYFNNNEVIDVIVKYNVKLPLPIKIISHIPVVQRATVRAFMGGDESPSVSGTDEEDGSTEDEVTKVYVSKKGSSYHRFGCYSIFKEIEPLDLHDAKQLGLEPCKKCRPPLNSIGEYTVFKSKRSDDGKYHKDGCIHLFKDIIEMNLDEAKKKYKPCKICKPTYP